MVLLFLKGELQLDDDNTLIRSVYELSDTRNFSNILAKSDNDANKYAVMFNIELDPTITYYARAQCLLTTGWTNYSNLDVIEVRLSGLNGYRHSIMPSKIATPILTTNFDVNRHDLTDFIISAKGFDKVGNSTHTSTIYFITDINNNVVWYKVGYTELEEMTVKSVLLEDDSIYRVHAIFGSSSGDYSQTASRTIRTQGNSNVVFIADSDVTLGTDYSFKLEYREGIDTFQMKLYKFDDTIDLVTETLFGSFKHSIASTFFTEGVYLLKVKSNLDTTYKNMILQAR